MADPKYDAEKGKQTTKDVFNKANKVAKGTGDLAKSAYKAFKNRKKFLSLLGANSKITALMLKAATIPMLIVFGFIIIAILLCTVFVSPSLLFTSVQDTRTISQKIRGVLIQQFDGSEFDATLKTYMQSTYGCDSMYVNGGSEEAGTNVYYYLTEYEEDLTQRATRTLVNIGEGASKTCYVDFSYKNLPMFTSVENDDSTVTADDIVYAYAQAVDSTISLFNGSYGELTEEGDLGKISPATDYGYAYTTDGMDQYNMAGYYSPFAVYEHYRTGEYSDKMKEIIGVAGYNQHSLGDTISIQWTGDNAPTTTVEDTVDENGNVESGKGEEIPAACIANPGNGEYKSAGFVDATCDSYNQYAAASTGNYITDEDGKYYVKLSSQNYTLRCNYQNAAGVKACFEDDKIKKTIEIAVDNGFILRYPYGKENETGYKGQYWTFTYVGKDLAKTLYNNGDWITLESYYGVSGSSSYEADISSYDYNADYTDGIAGGSSDALSLGVANKLHYVSNSDDTGVVNCGGVLLKENACTAYKEFQTAVTSYKESGEETKKDTSNTSNDEIKEIQYFDYSHTSKVDENGIEDEENGTEVMDPTLTDEGQKYLDSASDEDYEVPTDDDLVNQIKNTDGIFSIEGDYSEWTETSAQYSKGIKYRKKSYTAKEGCNIEEERRNGNTDMNPCLGDTIEVKGSQRFDEVYTVDVPLKIDLRNYRKEDIENTIADAIEKYVNEDQGQCIFDDGTDNYTTLLSLLDEEEPSLNCTQEELTQLFWLYVGYYYNNNIASLGAPIPENSAYYDSKGNKYENIADDGTAFADVEGKTTCLYMRIINGTPTTKKRLSSANITSPEQIAEYGENYSTSYTSGGESYMAIARTIRDDLVSSHGYSMVNSNDGYIQCVEFAWWRAWLSYPDINFAAGDGKNVASALVTANQGKFELVNITDASQMSENYAGSIISYGSDKYGHVLFLEKAEQEGGVWYIWISEGNFAPVVSGLGTININKKYELNAFLEGRHCNHTLTLAVPVG